MILITNVMLPLDTDFKDLTAITATALKLPAEQIVSAKLYRKSVDARHKNDIRFCCSILAEITGNEEQILTKIKNAQSFTPKKYDWPKCSAKPAKRPVIAGFGPAGMFAALLLARAGLCPIVLERGGDVDTRLKDVQNFFAGGTLNESSNIQFGEGGAGTFSDGKLNTGIKDVRCRTVLEDFVRFGAPKKILIDAKPHIGTDILVQIVKNIRKEVIALGGEVRFFSPVDALEIEGGKLISVSAAGQPLECSALVLATGHSARDTFALLKEMGVSMVRKPFAMGVRIEHLQSDINRALYGNNAKHPALGAADYKLAVHLPNGRGVYTFCMCPGGEVVNASSEQGGIAVNGMSYSNRAGCNANSAVLVGVEPQDIPGEDVMAGCYLQREIEQKAYTIAGGAVPVTTVGSFVFGKPDQSKKVQPTVKPSTQEADFTQIFPLFITESLKEGIKALDRKLSGFADPAAILTAPETRSSSPIRIVRTENFQSESITGLFPCGEGAGYAGGIVSAAVDGMRAAEAVIAAFEAASEKH